MMTLATPPLMNASALRFPPFTSSDQTNRGSLFLIARPARSLSGRKSKTASTPTTIHHSLIAGLRCTTAIIASRPSHPQACPGSKYHDIKRRGTRALASERRFSLQSSPLLARSTGLGRSREPAGRLPLPWDYTPALLAGLSPPVRRSGAPWGWTTFADLRWRA